MDLTSKKKNYLITTGPSFLFISTGSRLAKFDGVKNQSLAQKHFSHVIKNAIKLKWHK